MAGSALLSDQLHYDERGRIQGTNDMLVSLASGTGSASVCTVVRVKRGGARTRVTFDEPLELSVDQDDDVLALHEVLDRLAERDAEQAEIVVMRFFGGLSVEEVAAVKGVSKRSIEAEWTMIKAWLRRELGPG